MQNLPPPSAPSVLDRLSGRQSPPTSSSQQAPNMPPPRDTTPRKRRRPALACTRCRSRKVKCDRNLPCNQCIRMNCAPSCIFTLDERLPPRHPAHQQSGAQHLLSPPVSSSVSVADEGSANGERGDDASSSGVALKLSGAIWRRQTFNPMSIFERADATAGADEANGVEEAIADGSEATSTRERPDVLLQGSPSEEEAQVQAFSEPSVALPNEIGASGPSCPFEAEMAKQQAKGPIFASEIIFSTNKASDSPDAEGESMRAALNQLQQISEYSKSIQTTLNEKAEPPDLSAAQKLLNGVRELEQKLGKVLVAQEEPEKLRHPYRKSSELPAGWTFEKTRLFAQGHWRSCLEKFYLILRAFHRAEMEPDSEVSKLLHQCKLVAKEIKRPVLLPQLHPNELYTILPARETVDRLVTAYLSTFETVYRVVHVPSFRQEYTKLWQNPAAASTSFIMRLLAIMAVGSCFVDAADDTHATRLLASQWIHRVQAWMSAPSEKPRTNIIGLQVHCLVLIARQAIGVGGDMVWLSAGTLIRTAIHMGLHRDPSHIPYMSVFQSEMRRRLWATVLEISLQTCVDAAAPPLVSLNDYDTKPPSNIDDEELHEDMRELPASKPSEEYTSNTVQVLLMQSFPVRLNIAAQLADFRKDINYQDALRLGNQLQSACRSNYRLFRLWSTTPNSPLPFHIKLIDLMTHRFLISLHSGFALQAFDNPALYYSHKVSIDCAVFLAGTDRWSESPEQYDFHRVKLLGSGMFRDVYILCFLFISLEMLATLDEENSYLSTTAQSSNRKDMYDLLANHATLLQERSRLAETNVKGHLKWSCIQAQINALEAGLPQDQVELKIMEAAKQSLLASLEILKTRLRQMNTYRGETGLVVAPEVESDLHMNDIWDVDPAYDLMGTGFNFGMPYNVPDPWFFPGGTAIDGQFWSLKT